MDDDLCWRKAGFWARPRTVVVNDVVRVYRAWGGGSTEYGSPRSAGIFLTFDAPTSRMDAERCLAIFEYGNLARYVSVFALCASPTRQVTLYVGRAHPGDPRTEFGSGAPGSQIYMPILDFRRFARKESTAELRDDVPQGKVVVNLHGSA